MSFPRTWSADIGNDLTLDVLAYYPHATEELYSVSGSAQDAAFPALKFRLFSLAMGKIPGERWLALAPNPLGFLLHDGGASSITDAAYRFARHEPGIDVVLFGTGEADHLRANIASLLAPPLPLADRLTLTKLVGRLSGVGLDPPDSMPGFSSS